MPVFDIPHKFVSIAAGPNHLIALTPHSDIYSWGIDEDGRLGRKPTHTRSAGGHPAMQSLVLLGPKRGKGRKAVYIGAGSKSSFAVDENGMCGDGG
jgi:alpha-tubulin suppressor-like RCC1 family protein